MNVRVKETWEKNIVSQKACLLLALVSLCCESLNPVYEELTRNGTRITASCYALVHGVIIDGTGAAPLQNGTVVVRGQSILAAGPETRTMIPPDAEIVDVRGTTILPGFINAHVHKAFDETRLRTWAWNGVTTVRDEAILSSLSIDQAIAIRDSALRKPECARLIIAGFMITVPGGYGGLAVTSPADARQRVIDELDKGVDMIKISQEDGYAGRHGLPKLSAEEMAVIISAAHERRKIVSAHITQSAYWGIVVQAGVDDVAHVACDVVSDAVLDATVTKGILLVPTFTVFRNYSAPVGICIENVLRFVQKGGMVALGNDFAGGPGDFEEGIPFYELDCMRSAGMSPMQVIVACTRNAARAAQLDDKLGTIEAGKVADLLVVKGDPLKDLSALKSVALVIHGGINIRSEI